MTKYETFGPHVIFFPTLTMLLVGKNDTGGDRWITYLKGTSEVLNWYEKLAGDMYNQDIADGLTHEEIMVKQAT